VTRVNLLRAMPDRGPRSDPFSERRRGAIACGLLLASTSCGLGIWAWRIHRESARLGLELARAGHDMVRLRPVVAEAEALGLASLDLQRHVEVLEGLRSSQRGPAQLVEEIRRAVPDDCWLTAIADDRSDAVRIEGRGPALSSLFLFVERLQRSDAFAGGVEVLESHTASDPDGDLTAFSVRAARSASAGAVLPASRSGTPGAAARVQ
jgi:hypothetical protein